MITRVLVFIAVFTVGWTAPVQAKVELDAAMYLDSLPQSGPTYITMTLTRYVRNQTFLPSRRTFPVDKLHAGAFNRMMARPSRYLGYGHVEPSADNVALFASLGKFIHHVRDPRDALASWLKYTERHRRHRFTLGRVALPPSEYWGWNSEQKADWQIDHFYSKCVAWLSDWAEELEREDKGYEVLVTTFEDMVKAPRDFFQEILNFYGADPEAFKERDLYEMYRGQWHFDETDVGIWRDVLTDEQQNRINAMLPDSILEYYGWER